MNIELWKLHVIRAVSGLTLFYTMDKVFMQLRGLSVSEIVVVEVVYAVTILLLEVPTGALADRWSRKYVLALNLAFFIGNILVWLLAHDLSLFIVGVMLGSVHAALLSGTYNSLLYDTLQEAGQADQATRVFGLTSYYHGIGAVAAGVLGGVVASAFGIEATFWLTLLPATFGLVLCFTIVEPKIHRTTGEISYWKHIVEASKYVAQHPTLYHTIMLIVMFTVSYKLIDEYVQLYFYNLGSSLLALGVIGGSFYLLEVFGGRLAAKLAAMEHRNLYLLLFLLSALGYVMMYVFQSALGMLIALVPLFCAFISHPLLDADLHHKLPSHFRATGESYISLVASLVFVPVGLAFGSVADMYSLPMAYLYVGTGLAIYVLIYLAVSYRKI